jgi:hypothetical protein
VIRQRACISGLVVACLATAAIADPLIVNGPSYVLDGDIVVVAGVMSA